MKWSEKESGWFPIVTYIQAQVALQKGLET